MTELRPAETTLVNPKYDLEAALKPGTLLENRTIGRATLLSVRVEDLTTQSVIFRGLHSAASFWTGFRALHSRFESSDFEGVHFKDAYFYQVAFMACSFRQVVFERCTFDSLELESVLP